MAPLRFLVLDEDAAFRRLLRGHLSAEWPTARIVERSALVTDDIADFDLVLLGHPLGAEQGFQCLRALGDRAGRPPVVLLARQSDEFFAVDARKAGAASCLPKARVSLTRLVNSIRAGLEAPSPAGALAPGEQRLGRATHHRLIARLYSGDLSSVYLAEPDGGGQRVAYKVLRQIPDASDDGALDRFLQEYEALARLRHPNVVRIHALGVADDHAYIAMEYLDAGSLAARLARPLDRAAALGYTRQIAAALDAIHRAGILHRDLKPANVMFRTDGTLALIDFGLAKQARAQAALTGVGQIFGTPHYMSPEQGHAAETDARSDLYSLGCILYEMLTGERPFTASSPMIVIYQHANAPRPRLPAEHGVLQPLLDRMLATDPAARFQSAGELLQVL